MKRNSSTILTCMGAAGVVATGVAVGRATPKAIVLLEQAEEEKGEKLTKLEVVQVAGPVYIPSVLIGMGAITCIFGANALNKRKQAALISAYTLLDSSYKDYKAKVEEVYGEGANVEITREIAKDKYEEQEIQLEEDEMLFFDHFSGRYFNSTMEKVIKAEYEVNKLLVHDGGVYLNEFYDQLGIDRVEGGYELGWSNGILESMHWDSWIEFKHDMTVTDDGLECCIISMYEPVIDFAYY